MTLTSWRWRYLRLVGKKIRPWEVGDENAPLQDHERDAEWSKVKHGSMGRSIKDVKKVVRRKITKEG